MSRRQRAENIAFVATLAQAMRQACTLSQKFNTLNFARFFFFIFSDFFQCRITCARVATHAIFAAHWRRDNVEKNRITIANKKLLMCSDTLVELSNFRKF